MRFLPGLALVRRYQPTWLRDDLVAGVVLTALLVPQGMAYAELAGLPPVTGIYATMIPLLAYALFGPSRILVMGPDSAVVPLVAATVIPIAGSAPEDRVAVAATLAVAVGVLCVIGGIARLGFVTELLSKPVRVGFLAGIALVVIVDQTAKVLGIDVESEGLFLSLTELIQSLRETQAVTAAIGLGTIAVLVVLRVYLPRVPGPLIAVVGGIALVVVLGLQDQVETVGEVPAGLPVPALPSFDPGQLPPILIGALAIALVAFADTSVLSRAYAARLGDRVSPDQELFALGAANVAAGFFQGFPISSSSTRTPAAESAGAKSQLTGVVAAVAIGLVLLFATGILAPLPDATLAAIVIVAVSGLIDLDTLRRLARLNRPDFGLAIAALLGVALIGVIPGIGIAIGLSVMTLLWRAWHPHTAVLGRVDGLKGYHDQERHPEGRQTPGLILLRFDAPLFFANGDVFRETVLDAVDAAEPPVRRVVVASEPITDVDTTAADVLLELLDALDRRQIGLAFAELKDPVKDKVKRYGLTDRLAQPPFPPTVGEAVHQYLEAFDVPWTDWEDAETHEAGQEPAR
jgi:high affinity sulfate transporter 1